MSLIRITEVKQINLLQCVENAVHVRWLNRNGGMDYYTFKRRQLINFDTSESVVYKKYISLLSLATGTHRKMGAMALKKMVCGAETITEDQFNNLAVMRSSPYVQMKINGKWMDVIATDGTDEFDTKEGFTNYEITFILPEYFTQNI